MPFLLRKITKGRWYRGQRPPWLAEGDVPADPFKDLSTSQNTLSVWRVEDDRSNLDQVITALAATADAPSNVDYALLDWDQLDAAHIIARQTPGETPDQGANAAWHHDLVELSGLKLIELVRLIRDERTPIARKSEKDVMRLIAAALRHGRLDRSRLSPRMEQKLGG